MSASVAASAFAERCKDAKRLLEIHKDLTGKKPGRKWRVEVLNRSAIVLISASWEAYNEEIVKQLANHAAATLSGPDPLPLALRKRLARLKEEDKHELAVWALAGSGWKTVVRENATELASDLNTPKAGPLDELFQKALGIEKISDCWKAKKRTGEKTRERLDEFVTMRGAIAHAGEVREPVRKRDCEEFLALTKQIVACVDSKVNEWAETTTGAALF